ncbi:MAG: hypothetical protein ACK5LP_02425 [Campylobacteraceae bacterium]
MRKCILVVLSFFCLHANAQDATIYEKNCVSCHKELDVGIDKFFYRYLMVFSSELAVKMAIKDYLMHPMAEKSLIYEGLLEKYGVKEPSDLSERELEEAIKFIGRDTKFLEN